MAREEVGDADRCVKSREMMMVRVVYSQGPFLSSEKRSARREGNRVGDNVSSCARAREVVLRALMQRSVSWSRASSCSSLLED